MPRLTIKKRIMLYLVMVISTAVSIISLLVTDYIMVIQLLIYGVYAVAAVSIGFGTCYLVKDIKMLINTRIKPSINNNQYTGKIFSSYRLRTIVFAVPGTGINIIFALFNGVMGIISHSAWFGSLSAYYLVLSIMRLSAVLQGRAISGLSDDNTEHQSLHIRKEMRIFRRNSVLFIILSIVLLGMVILLSNSEGGKNYPGTMIYVVAIYAFVKIITSTINVIKVNRHQSPLLTIIRRIGYLDACVSILNLQTAMFSSFGSEMDFGIMMNEITGGAVCLITLGMGIYGLITTKRLENRLIEKVEAAND